MRVLLIHNPTARSGRSPTARVLTRALREAGHEVEYRSTRDERWRAALQDAGDLVAVAGGDGTVAEVLRALALLEGARARPPATILPSGTANNIARTLGIQGAPRTLAALWSTFRLRPFDVGRIEGVEDAHAFVEAVGAGALTAMISALDGAATGLNQEIRRRAGIAGYVALLSDLLRRRRGTRLRLRLDGQERSGAFLMVEALNIGRVGPNLLLAGAADPGDGELDVLLVGEDERRALADYLDAQVGGADRLPPLPTVRARAVELAGDAATPLLLRRDDVVRPLAPGATARLTLQPGALRLLAPAQGPAAAGAPPNDVA